MNFMVLGWIRLSIASKILDQDGIWTGLMEKSAVFLLLKTFILLAFWTSFGLGLHIFYTFWTTVGLGLSFENAGLELDRKIWQSAHFCLARQVLTFPARSWAVRACAASPRQGRRARRAAIARRRGPPAVAWAVSTWACRSCGRCTCWRGQKTCKSRLCRKKSADRRKLQWRHTSVSTNMTLHFRCSCEQRFFLIPGKCWRLKATNAFLSSDLTLFAEV